MTRRALLLAAVAPKHAWIMPAESAPHKRTWMAFGANQNIWGARLLPEVERNLVAIARAVSNFEPVSILIPSFSAPSTNPKIDFVLTPLDDLWIRDTGPLFVRGEQGQRAAVDLNFDGWGDKQAHDRDANVSTIVARKAALRRIETGLILEGGAIEVDGAGTAILTESSILNRNPDIPKAEIERELSALLGLEKIIWLPGAKGRDITDGHIDSYARFARPGLVLAAADPARPETKQHIKILEAAKLEVAIMQAPTKLRTEGISAGYLGFYICNGAVIAQEFGDKKADHAAAETLRKAFPGRQIVQLNTDGLTAGGGTIHGATLQEPS